MTLLHKIFSNGPLSSILGRKILMFILLFSSIITLTGTLLQLYVEYRGEVSDIHRQVRQVENGHLESLTNSLWTLNSRQIEIELNNILTYPDIGYLEIIENDTVLYKCGKSRTPDMHITRFPMVYRDKGETVPIGALKVFTTFAGLRTRMMNRIFLILTTQALKTFCMSLFILFIIYRAIIVHLIRLSAYTSGLSLKKLDTRPDVHRTRSSRPDELDVLVDAVDNMRRQMLLDMNVRNGVLEKLKEREERLSVLFENTADAIYVARASTGRLVQVNSAACRTTGYTRQELLRLHVHDIDRTLPDTDAFVAYANDIETRDAVYMDSFHVRKDKTSFPVEVTISPLVMAGRRHIIGIARDITRRRETEAALKKSEERLRHAQKIESIGNLAGGIAHDFNNILSPIMGMSELLLEEMPEGSVQYDNVLEIFTAGTRGRDLVRQILTFSRQGEQQKVPVKIQTLVEDVFKLTRATIPANIEMVKDIAPDCGLILADDTQLHQVGMNLITNAFHAVERDGGRITVRLKETLLPEDLPADATGNSRQCICLTVADTGQGIPPHVMDHLFDPYFTTKSKGKGTGLGLAVVHGIVKAHDGVIHVKSNPGDGTEFAVYFPLIKAADTDDAPANDVAVQRPGTEKILVVDDEEAVGRMEKLMLQRLGYQVTLFHSSKAALDAFRSAPHAFDLVLSDMTMPGMTGDQLSRELLVIRPDLPIVICTGYSEKHLSPSTTAPGIRAVLMKPVTKAKLAEVVRDTLEGNSDG